MRYLALLLALLWLASAPASADPADSSRSDTEGTREADLIVDAAPYQIRIARTLVTDMRLHDTLDVTFDTHSRPIGGFDLKVAVEDPRVDILEVLPGKMYDSCRWEYFNSRRMESEAVEGAPYAVWQVVGMAQVMADSVQPLCFGVDSEMSVFRLVVANDHVGEMDDAILPILFYWEDCTDNTISDKTGNSLFISRRVYDYSGGLPDSSTGLFPSRIGAPAQCVNPAVRNPMKRLIDFHNGAIEFRLDLSPPADSL